LVSKRTAPLTRDAIFAAALAIIDRDGYAALSMRRLAGDLGVEAMSLYHHVRDKRALLGGVVELSLRAQAPAPPRPGTPWEDVVVAMVLAFRRTLVAHPNVLPLMAAHPPSSREGMASHVERPLRYFLSCGVPAKKAGRLLESLFALGFGHAMLTINYKEMRGRGVPPIHFNEASFASAVRHLIDGFSAARTPQPGSARGKKPDR
jgi:AcrR family transcriptional regulator